MIGDYKIIHIILSEIPFLLVQIPAYYYPIASSADWLGSRIAFFKFLRVFIPEFAENSFLTSRRTSFSLSAAFTLAGFTEIGLDTKDEAKVGESWLRGLALFIYFHSSSIIFLFYSICFSFFPIANSYIMKTRLYIAQSSNSPQIPNGIYTQIPLFLAEGYAWL